MKTRAEGDAGSGGVSCVQNHGSNCTVAFGISSSNCVINMTDAWIITGLAVTVLVAIIISLAAIVQKQWHWDTAGMK